jgi:hypothetical protein
VSPNTIRQTLTTHAKAQKTIAGIVDVTGDFVFA